VSLKIKPHGGRCCGIKTIEGFGCGGPDFTLKRFSKPKKFDWNKDYYGRSFTSGYNFYPFSRPEETVTQRLDAYLEFLKEYRSLGLVEVALKDRYYKQRYIPGEPYSYYNPNIHTVYNSWEKVLEERGFKEVSRFINSNTSTMLVVLHLIMKGS
jgi:hypothetical protein